MVPEPGQLVEVRRRRWIVGDVRAASLDTGNLSYLVRVTSVDEDGPRDELDVVWDLEPGARVLERAGLPKPAAADAAEDLDAFLDAVRWGAATNADRALLQAPFRSGATIEDFQLDPVARAVDMARVNLLIADDVGLGKTIEAGLVVQELLLRHRARTVLIVVPASLQVKWQTEMREKFGLEFRIVDTAYLHDFRRRRGIHANPWTSYPRLITSMDWAKSGEGLRLIDDVLPPHTTYPRRFDVLIVDEAHNVAPAASDNYAVDSQRTRLIRKLAPHFEHKLFLSATPHNGYQQSFTSLLELLDDRRFSRSVQPDPKQLQQVMVRRLKSELVDSEGRPLYPRRELRALDVEYDAEEREVHGVLSEYAKSRLETSSGTRHEYATSFVLKLLKKRLFSSPRAFARTLAAHRTSLEGTRERREHGDLDDRVLRRALLLAEEDQADDVEAERLQDEATHAASAVATLLTSEQKSLLQRLTSWAERAKNRPDAKARAVLAWLRREVRPEGEWSDRRVIIFTEYRDTMTWLEEILAANGYAGERLAKLHGGLPHDEREVVKASFQADPSVSPVRILLATDAASEGIDLQNHCDTLLHLEIPWNPNVMEQRNGRVDRHGQRSPTVSIWHPVGKRTAGASDTREVDDSEFLMRAATKVDAIRQDLGSVGPVLARRIEDAMLGRARSLDTSDAERKADVARGSLAVERRLRDRVADLHARLMEAREEFGLEPARVARAVKLALRLDHQLPLVPVSLPGAPDGTVFDVPVATGSWGRASAGLEHPFTNVRRSITFDYQVAKGRDDVVLAHLEHNLVQLALRLLRAEVWSLEENKRLHRVTVRSVPDELLPVPVVGVWSRLVVTGGDHRRLHEELTFAGGELGHDRFVRIPQVLRMRELERASSPGKVNEGLFHALADRFGRHETSILAAVEARTRDRMATLVNTLERRAKAEAEDVERVLDDLEAALRREIEHEEPIQPMLFSPPEAEQLKRDRAALRERLRRIPEERARELEATRQRHADPTPRTFPVAVVFLVPDSTLRGRA
ncbi:DISARM system SNF2-like helicase DrmD [Deinococcus peraridilitoris]|uniref:DNA/RNA helicase, superfamily II, SNF2 family n=1 Tax=Deinococcus peraridilitoris (strain DSM 19664 / LMG 22246 / CIP 109416 / KR-200) TaxID=937777 RepID=L0A2E4_DEIPD|nr:DISARM system SNF2-like helicase DrmD [Deinococcus peraridilitoris]AFZ67165.1 DNA/RNA helicase, superfamily II, SNF2 family [Deinococcus peraridilitoris DSM 19664]